MKIVITGTFNPEDHMVYNLVYDTNTHAGRYLTALSRAFLAYLSRLDIEGAYTCAEQAHTFIRENGINDEVWEDSYLLLKKMCEFGKWEILPSTATPNT